MKNIQVIDSADNCTYDIFSLTDEQFKILFPQPGQDIEFISDIISTIEPAIRSPILKEMWTRRVPKLSVKGIHGTLFYELDHKKKFYPTKRDAEMVTGYPKPDTEGNEDTSR